MNQFAGNTVIASLKEHGASRFPLSSYFCLTANEKDFSHSLEMTIGGEKRVLSYRHSPHMGKAFVWEIVCMFPPSVGRRCPEGAEVGFRSGGKGNVREAVFLYFRLY